MNKKSIDDFYIVAYEWGAENPTIETWACEKENAVSLVEEYSGEMYRKEVDAVPGAFQILNLLSQEECTRFRELSEGVGFIPDAAVSLPRSVRHNDSLTWIVEDKLHDMIWSRCKDFLYDKKSLFNGKEPLGLNKRFRFYRYAEGDYFSYHTDGAWPGSAVKSRRVVSDAYGDRFSQMTFLLFLSDDFVGGETSFLVDEKNREFVDVRTPLGGVLCFPHGTHPLHCLHASKEILSGSKYIIRTDVLYEK